MSIFLLIPSVGKNIVIDLLEYEITQNCQPCFLTLLEYSAYSDQELKEIQDYVDSAPSRNCEQLLTGKRHCNRNKLMNRKGEKT